MAIKNLQTQRRLKNLASSDVTAFALADFRSEQEIQEYLNNVKKKVTLFASKLKSIRDFYTKVSAKFRIKKYVTANTTPELAGKEFKRLGMTFNDSHSYTEEDVKRTMLKDIRRPPPKSKLTDVDLKVLPADMAKLNAKSLELADLYNDLEKLDWMEASINAGKFDFLSKKSTRLNPVLTQVKAVRKTTQSTIDKAEKFLSSVAKKIAPAPFVKNVESIVNGVLDYYTEYYTDFSEKLYLTTIARTVKEPPKGKTKTPTTKTVYDLKFVHYFNIEMETEDGDSEDLFLVYTGIVDLNTLTLSMYVSFYNDFVPPDRIDFGRNFFSSASEGTSKSIALLSTEAFETEIERVPLPKASNKLLTALKKHPWIGSVAAIKVSEDAVIVRYKKDVRKSDVPVLERKILSDVAVQLYAALEDKTTKPKVKAKTISSARSIVSKFYLGIPTDSQGREGKLDARLTQKLRSLFPFTDEQVKKIVRMVNY